MVMNVSEILRELPQRTCHLLFDTWTSRSNRNVLGTKAQFISKDWKLNNVALGFKELQDSNTAANLNYLLRNHIANDVGLAPDKVITIV